MSKSVQESNIFQSFIPPKVDWGDVKICTESPCSPTSYPHGYGVGANLLITFFFSQELHEMSRTAHKCHVQQHHPHGARGVEGSFHEKQAWWKFSRMSKTTQNLFSIPSPPQGFWPNSLLICCWKLHEIPRTPQELNVWQLSPHEERYWAISLKIIFDGNCMECTELHEAHVSWVPTSPQWVGRAGYNVENAMSNAKC